MPDNMFGTEAGITPTTAINAKYICCKSTNRLGHPANADQGIKQVKAYGLCFLQSGECLRSDIGFHLKAQAKPKHKAFFDIQIIILVPDVRHNPLITEKDIGLWC